VTRTAAGGTASAAGDLHRTREEVGLLVREVEVMALPARQRALLRRLALRWELRRLPDELEALRVWAGALEQRQACLEALFAVDDE
jgi:anti-sigma factor RsiW